MQNVYAIRQPNGVDRPEGVAAVIRHDLQHAWPHPLEGLGGDVLLAVLREVQRVSDLVLHRSLAHDRITAAIGVGGMSEVYRATDTKLSRDVALKVLPAEMAGSPDRLERFRREATGSSLRPSNESSRSPPDSPRPSPPTNRSGDLAAQARLYDVSF